MLAREFPEVAVVRGFQFDSPVSSVEWSIELRHRDLGPVHLDQDSVPEPANVD